MVSNGVNTSTELMSETVRNVSVPNVNIGYLQIWRAVACETLLCSNKYTGPNCDKMDFMFVLVTHEYITC